MIVCKYKFDSSIYNNLIPEFNSGYNGYSVNDTTDGNIVTRTIECDTLPTFMRFGQMWTDGEVQEDYTKCLLEILDMNTSELTNCNSMFRYCNNLTSINCNWNTSKVTTMHAMFNTCTNLAQLDVSNFNTSQVTNMHAMFYGCSNLTQLDVSNFNTSQVTSMHAMFSNCTNLTQLDVSNFNTSEVTDMGNMFNSCKNLTSLDVSNFDTSKVNTMHSMFRECHKLALLDVSNWDTSKVTTMYSMFYQCKSLRVLSLSSWNFDSVTDTTEMFYNCFSLVTLDVPRIKVLIYGNNFFGGNCPVKYIRVNNLDVINTIEPQLKYTRTSDNPGYIITNIDKSSIPADTISALSAKNWTVVSDSTLTKVAEYVYDPDVWASLIPEFDASYVSYFIDDEEIEGETDDGTAKTLIKRTIWSLGKLPTLIKFGTSVSDLSGVNHSLFHSLIEVLYLNTSNVIDMNGMFRYCLNLTKVYTKGWDTSNVTNMAYMFCHCISLTSLDVSNFDTSSVTSMISMFNDCRILTSLDASNFDTSKVTNMAYMFQECRLLTSLDISNFDTSKVTNMAYMFVNCQSLTSLDVSNFDTSKVTIMEGMFDNTSKLVNIGMLYCSPSTINTISSNLSNTLQKNIWIQNVKPSELPSYDYISYKKYKEEKELNLNSPLLEGDKIVKKDGKMYHYHKMGKVVFDGREGWWDRSSYYISDTQTRFSTSINAKPCTSGIITLICDKYPVLKAVDGVAVKVGLGINLHVEGKTIYITVPKTTLEEFKTHLQANPTTVVYELANPYYEEISNDTLYLSIDKLSDYKMVVNNSTIPTKNMVQNRTFSTITLKPNTVYTVKFDRIGTDELTIDLGGTITTCVGNKVEIMTSNEITRDDIVFYGDDEISNVMVIESSFDENNIPKENFEGLKSSFEDRRLFNEEDSILYNTNNTYYNEKIIHSPSLDFLNPLTKYTVVIKDKTNKISYNKICNADGSIMWTELTNKKIYTFTTPSTIALSTHIFLYSPAQYGNSTVSFVAGDENSIQIYLFEGDWTHLTEEDFNNLGKYKVEYKTINCPIEFGKGGRIE